MLVDMMAAVVAESEGQLHPLLVELVGGSFLRHADGSLGGVVSLCCAGG